MAPKDDSSGGINLSRRNFLKSTGVVGLAATVVGSAEPAAQVGPAALGPGEVPVRLNVNGKQLNLMIEPRVTLLDALRTRADLTGNKRGCDRGACGACTMLVDGRPVYSCSTLAIEVQGTQIRNVEGLAKRRHAASRATGVLRQGRVDVRVLHAGIHHGQRRSAREESRIRRRSRSGRASTGTSAAAARSPASSKRCRA